LATILRALSAFMVSEEESKPQILILHTTAPVELVSLNAKWNYKCSKEACSISMDESSIQMEDILSVPSDSNWIPVARNLIQLIHQEEQ